MLFVIIDNIVSFDFVLWGFLLVYWFFLVLCCVYVLGLCFDLFVLMCEIVFLLICLLNGIEVFNELICVYDILGLWGDVVFYGDLVFGLLVLCVKWI